ncbi:MAG: Na+-dependent transporter [Alphaproteobacteria bacterium]
MSILLAPLAWLGRQGTTAVAIVVFLAMATPQVGALMKDFLTEIVVALLCIAFIRVDIGVLRRHLSRPYVVIAATVWTVIGIPFLFGGVCLLFGMREYAPDLFTGLVMQFSASPMMAAPALVLLMGLDATLVLIVLVASTALIPLTAPFFAWLLIGADLSLPPLALGLKLLGILGSATVISVIIRRIAGMDGIRRYGAEIDGINIIVLYIFAAPVMELFLPSLMRDPLTVLWVSLLALALFAAYYVVTFLLFIRAGREQARALGIMTSLRNLGLLIAATGGAVPELSWIYFAASQIPIHLAPALLKRLAARKRAILRDMN